MSATVLASPHPPVSLVDAPNFDYAAYGWRHISVRLGDDGVLVVTLDRPKRMNAFTNEMCHDYVFALELADVDPRVKVVVITGAGKAFCAGADLQKGFGPQGGAPISAHRDGGGQSSLAVHRCRKAVIAAVNGNAIGVGITMILPADIRFVAQNAKLAIPFAKRGITLEGASGYFLSRLVGHANALELAITGDTYTPDAPAMRGLWNRVLPAEQVLPEALALARRLARENSVASMALNKAMLWNAPPTAEGMHLVDSKAVAFTSQRDGVEGIRSFLEKREPRFGTTLRELEASGFFPWWTTPDVTGLKTRGLAKL